MNEATLKDGTSYRVKDWVNSRIAAWPYAQRLDRAFPRLADHRLDMWVREHRVGAFMTSALIVGLLVYSVADPNDFDGRLKTLTAIATGIGAFGLFLNLMFTSETVDNSGRTLEHQLLTTQ